MKKDSGYSLIELMTMLGVVAIVLAIGAPNLMTFFQGNRMVTNTNDLISALHVARSEAVKRGHRVSVCKSSNANTASPTCDASPATGWETGWIVFEEDTTRAVPMLGTVGSYETASSDLILRVHDAASGNNTTITPDNPGILNFVSFTSRGEPKVASGASQTGLFRVCDERGMLNAAGNVIARGIVLSPSGRIRFTKDPLLIVGCP